MSAPSMPNLPNDVEDRELVEMDTSSNEGVEGEGEGEDAPNLSADNDEEKDENDENDDDDDGENEEESNVKVQTDAPTKNADAELEAMKKRLHEMEQETMAMYGDDDGSVHEGDESATPEAGIAPTDTDAPKGMTGAVPSGTPVDESTAESDARSIYVGNVDYNATGEELNQYFQECGTINRVTIMCHKGTGQPKGYAYVEFKDREAVQNALILNESQFRGRKIKVVEKRTNIPGVTRGGFARGRGRFSRGWRGSFRGRPRGRGRGRARWAPY